jgi:2-haloacid dehalogenase
MNGTLFDPSPLGRRLPGEEPDAEKAAAVLEEAALMAAVETITGRYEDFSTLLERAVARRLALAGRPGRLSEAMEALTEMRPVPEAREALRALEEAGIGIGVLTNSSGEDAWDLLEAAGIGGLELILGTDEVRAFKPDRRVYEEAVRRLDADPREVVLVSAHWWDAVGAARAGLRSAWVSKRESVRLEVEPAPDHRGVDLLAVAGQIAAASY